MATLNLQVAASGDDNYEVNNGNTNNMTSTSLQLSASVLWSAVEFRSASAIKGTTINTATLSLYGFGATNLTIGATAYADSANSPANLSAAISFDISIRGRTTASASLSGTLSASGYTTFNVASIIQEVANNASWTGNIMILINRTSGTTFISAWDKVPTGTQAAKLDIDYSSGPVDLPVTVTPIFSSPFFLFS